MCNICRRISEENSQHIIVWCLDITASESLLKADRGSGEITVFPSAPAAALTPDSRWANWWTDDPSPEAAEGIHQGARTISVWREEFLRDFAARLERCRTPAGGPAPPR